MLKKSIALVLFLQCLVAAWGQHVSGSWRSIPMSGASFTTIQDTPSKVYYITAGSLYSFDKASGQTTFHAAGSKVSDSGISLIRYNGDAGYLAIGYSSGNIDLLYDNGKLVNLPEIKNTIITAAKGINDISFGKNNRLYAATQFGIVVYDDKNHVVKESGMYSQSIPAIMELGDYLAIWSPNSAGKYVFSYSPLKEKHNSLSKFVQTDQQNYANHFSVSDNTYLVFNGGTVQKVVFDPSKANPLTATNVVTGTGGKSLAQWKGGYYVAGNNGFHIIDPATLAVTKLAYPTTIGSQTISFWESPDFFWAANADGIGSYSLENGTATAVNEKYYPEASRQPNAWYAVNSPDGSGVMISGITRTDLITMTGDNIVSKDQRGQKLYHDFYDWKESKLKKAYKIEGENSIYGWGSSRILYDPVDPSIVYVGTLFDGVLIYKNEVMIDQYTLNKSPLNSGWGSQVFDMAFDRHGNLWFILWVCCVGDIKDPAVKKDTPVKMLPKASLDLIRQGRSAEVRDIVDGEYIHWEQPDIMNGRSGWMDAKIIFSSKADKGLVSHGGWGSQLFGIDAHGTASSDDDTWVEYEGIRDQDGTVANAVRKPCLFEDSKGRIWIGTDSGIYYVEDLDQIADGSSPYLNAIRPVVPRNDGTGYADYLLPSDLVYNMAEDSQGRKWIATASSGIFCVSEDGTEIIHNFTTENSPLLTNEILMVGCDPNEGGTDVIIGTRLGMFVYSDGSAPANDDYSEVYAFPNPVPHNYTGWITVNGLMENSTVAIEDADGKVVWQGPSEGGIVVWDGCDADGIRVRSGVYTVKAAQSASDLSPVTKLVVIN